MEEKQHENLMRKFLSYVEKNNLNITPSFNNQNVITIDVPRSIHENPKKIVDIYGYYPNDLLKKLEELKIEKKKFNSIHFWQCGSNMITTSTSKITKELLSRNGYISIISGVYSIPIFWKKFSLDFDLFSSPEVYKQYTTKFKMYLQEPQPPGFREYVDSGGYDEKPPRESPFRIPSTIMMKPKYANEGKEKKRCEKKGFKYCNSGTYEGFCISGQTYGKYGAGCRKKRGSIPQKRLSKCVKGGRGGVCGSRRKSSSRRRGSRRRSRRRK